MLHDAIKYQQCVGILSNMPTCFSSWTCHVHRYVLQEQFFQTPSLMAITLLKWLLTKSFSCKRNSMFIFHIWKLFSLSFSMLRTSKVDAMVVSRTIPKKQTYKNFWMNNYIMQHKFSFFQKIIKLWYHVGNEQWINKKIVMTKT